MMRGRVQTVLLAIIVSVFLFTSISHHLCRNWDLIKVDDVRLSPTQLTTSKTQDVNLAIREQEGGDGIALDVYPIRTRPVSILFHDWDVLIIQPRSSPVVDTSRGYYCLFQDGSTSKAKPAGMLARGGRAIFRCPMPRRVRRLRPFYSPELTHEPEVLRSLPEPVKDPGPEMMRWSFLAYETIWTEDDVIIFAKGVNNRQGVNVPAAELLCVFSNGVKTAVTSSAQEVFRCSRPDSPVPDGSRVWLEIGSPNGDTRVVPSIAAYEHEGRSLAEVEARALLCACTVVYNVAKFLKEWVIYHAGIGVERFVLYDNGSDDDLTEVVAQLVEAGYDMTTFLWPWPKTQEAAFSHSATTFNRSCTWMVYVDVDEFVFSPSWHNASQPSKNMLHSLLPRTRPTTSIGQISIKCLEFGPSNRRSHPKKGVTQGYTCRMHVEQRHKSIVLLDAVDPSLLNAIHHFQLKDGYRTRMLPLHQGVVNHYKYQAWPEFKNKFRRRVSAYVIDWREAVNLASKDRTPGLSHIPVEPKGWATQFCEVNDTLLRDVSGRWFGLDGPSGHRMIWQDQ